MEYEGFDQVSDGFENSGFDDHRGMGRAHIVCHDSGVRPILNLGKKQREVCFFSGFNSRFLPFYSSLDPKIISGGVADKNIISDICMLAYIP